MIRVGLVGYGYAGRTFHAPLVEAVDGLTLAAVASRDRDKVHRDRPSVTVVPVDELANDAEIDVVVIATPNQTHAPLAHSLLAAGKHVVVDKPFTTTVSEAETLAEAATRFGRLITVFHNRRWDGDFLTVRSLVAEGALGTIAEFESRADRYRPLVRDRWRERPGPGSGTWFDLGAHLVDQALQLFGMPESVTADLDVQRGSGAVDFFHVVLRYGSLCVVLRGSSLAVAPGPRFTIFGTRATYTKFGWDAQEDALKRGERPGASSMWGADPNAGSLARHEDDDTVEVTSVPNLPGDYRSFYRGLRDAIETGAAAPVSVSEAIAVMRVLEAGVASAEQRRTISVSL